MVNSSANIDLEEREGSTARVGFVSLGCPKATVDSEKILTQLVSRGYSIVNQYDEADVVVVNTCGFIDAARDESWEAIDEALSENGRVIVTGCLGAEQSAILARFPNVAAVTGPHDYPAVVKAVEDAVPLTESRPAASEAMGRSVSFEAINQRVALTPPHYAYLKVAEGCNHRCTFCIIPSMRGRLSSRPLDDVMREAEALSAQGVREIMVIAQDTSAYGADLRYQEVSWREQQWASRFGDLCRALSELGIWVRLHYVYPYPHVDKIIPLMRDGGILPYLDVPFQHGSPRVLRAMQRPAATENTLRRIESWRSICPEIAIRSSFIVGFPSETEQEFEELLAFLREARLDRVGCFEYSPVEGAAANALAPAIEGDVIADRRERLMQVQQAISADKLQQRVGTNVDVIVDQIDGERVIGRSYAEAPEIDGLIYVEYDENAPDPGSIVNVDITAASEYDLWGHISSR